MKSLRHYRRSIGIFLTLLMAYWQISQPLQSLQAATIFWDTNGAIAGSTAGAGGADGTWGTSTFWTTDAAGAITPTITATTAADDLFFSAGTNGGSGTVTINGTQLASSITFDDDVPLTLSGGTGITLGGTGSYRGIFVTGGSSGNTISTDITLASAVQFTNNSSGTLTLGAISNGANNITVNGTGSVAQTGVWGNGAGTVTYNGTGTLTLNQANTFTGGLTVAGGTVVGTANAAALGAGTLTLLAGNLRLTNTSGSNLNFGRNTTLNGTTTITSDVTVNNTTGNNYTFGTLGFTAHGSLLNIRAGSNVNPSTTAGVTFGTTTLVGTGTTFDVGAGANLTLGAITTTGLHFFKQGTGTLTLGTAADPARVAGTTFMNGGTLVLGAVGAIGTSPAILNVTSGTVDLATDASATGNAVRVLGNATFLSNTATSTAGITHTLGGLTSLGANTITIGKGAAATGTTAVVAFGGGATTNAATTFTVTNTGASLTLATLANGGYTTTFNGAGNVTAGGAITGAGGVMMNGSGTLNLNASNSYGGATTISSGTVALGNTAGLGVAATANVEMSGSAILSTNNIAAPAVLAISGGVSNVLQNGGSTTNSVFSVTPGANQTSLFAGTVQNGGGTSTQGITINGTGALTLSGNNTYTGNTTITAGRLNINSNTAIGGSASTLVITTGMIDNTSGSIKTLSNNNNVTVSGNFTFGGSNDLSFGTGTATNLLSRVVTLMGTGKTLTFGTWNNNYATSTTRVNAFPGSTSTLNIGTFISTSTGTVATILGNGNITITNGIQPTVAAAASVVYSNTGTLTLSGASSYTGATTLNSGAFILDASVGTASLPSGNLMTVGGGTFVFRGATGGGSSQTLGNITLAAGVSGIQVIGGTSGTTILTLGTISTAVVNSGTINFSVAGTGASIANSTSLTTGLLSNGVANARGGAFTFTTGGTVTNGVIVGGTTSFATVTGGSIAALGGQTTDALPTTGTTAVNYLQTVNNTALAGATEIYSLHLNPTASAQTISLGAQQLTLRSGGLLYTGTTASQVGSTVGDGTLRSLTASNSNLIVHNYGTGGLTLNSVIVNGSGVSVLTYDGSGTTTVAGTNTYTGITLAGGGAVVSIGANAALGAVGTGAALTLNNATLQATNTFGLDNAGVNVRAITLGPGGGTFDVTSSNVLTVLGVISSTGSLTKKGTGTLLINGGTISSYSGGFTNVQNGTLQLGSTLGTSSLTVSTIVVLGSSTGDTSGKLVLGDGSGVKAQTIAGLTTSGAGTANAVVGGNSSNSTLTYTGTVAVPTTFGGTLGGADTNENNLALAITTGALTLSGNNTYAGGTTINGVNILNINSSGTSSTNSAIGTGTFTVTSGSIDNTSGVAVALLTNNAVTLNGPLTFGGSNSLSFGTGVVTQAASQTVTLLGGTTSTSALTFGTWNISAAAQTLTVSAQQGSGTSLNIGTLNLNSSGTAGAATVLTGNGTINITKLTETAVGTPFTYSGSGMLNLLGAASDYTGLTTISGSTVKLGAGGNLPSANPLTFAAGGVFDLNGRNQTVGRLTNTAGLITNTSGSSVTFTASDVATSTGTFAGNLNFDITLATATAATLSGNFTNTGNLTFTNTNSTAIALTLSAPNVLNGGNVTFNANGGGAFTVSAPNFNPAGGVITNSGSGSATTTISGTIGSNVTAISNTNASQLTISGAVYLNSGGTTVTQSGTGTLLFGVATVNGTGNLTVVNSSTTGGAITFTAIPAFTGNLTFQATATTGTPGVITASGVSINNSGTITNNGSGSATTAISAIIGPAVTGVIQNGNSSLLLSGANTFTGGAQILKGSAIAGVSNATTLSGAFGPSAVAILLGNTTPSNTDSASLLANSFTVSNPVTVQAGSSGTLTIGNNGAATAAVFTGGISLSNNLTLSATGTGTLTVSTANITGTGNIIISSNSSAATGVTVSAPNLNQSGTITNAGTGSGAALISGAIGSGVTSITQNSATSNLTLSGADNSAFTSLIKVTNGTLTGSAATNVFGSNATAAAITLGDSTTLSTGATLSSSFASFVANNPITIVKNNNGGVLTISNAGATSNSSTWNGLITTNSPFTVTETGTINSGSLTFTGGVANGSGTGNDLSIVVSSLATSANISFTGATAVNNAGQILVSGGGASTTGGAIISAPIGSNVTNITDTRSAGTGAFTISGSTVDNQGNITFSGGAGTTVTFSAAAINTIGTITNNGTTTGTTTISGILGSTVGLLTQNSSSSQLTLSGNNASFVGGLTVLKGTVALNTSGGAIGSASNAVTLGDASGTASATLQFQSSVTYNAAPITVANVGGSGVLTIQGSTTTSDPTLASSITLNHDLVIAAGAAGATDANITFNGAISGTGNLDINYSATALTGLLTFNGDVNNNGTIVNRGNSTGATIINGVIGINVEGVTQNSSTSALVLAGANTYTAATTISVGTLQLGNAGTTGSLNTASVITNNGILAFNRTDTVTQGTEFSTGPISGSGAVQILSGTVVLNAANTYSGPTTISGGTLSAASLNSVVGGTSSSNLGAPVTVSNGTISIGSAGTAGTLLYTGTGETTDRVINLAGTTGGATLNQSGTGTLEFISDMTVTGVGNKTLTLTGSTTGIGTLSGAIANGTGNTALTKSGTGTWNLADTNTYSGTTTISGGTLVAQGIGALSPSTSVSIAGTATLKILDDGTGTISNASTTNFSLVNNQSTSTIFVGNNNTANGGTSSGTTTGSTIVLGNITGFSTANNTTLNIQGANGYRLQIGSVNVGLFTASTNGSIFNPTTAPITITGPVAPQIAQGANTGTLTLTLGGTAAGNIISGAITNATDFGTNGNAKPLLVTKSGTSDWTLTNTNTYTGITSVNGGTLTAQGNVGALSTGSAVALGAGTLRLLNDTAGTINQGNNLTVTNGQTTSTIFVGNTSNGTGSGTTTGSTIVLGDITSFGGPNTTTLNITGNNGYRVSFGNVSLGLITSGNPTLETFNPTTAPVTITGTIAPLAGQTIAGTGTPSVVLGGTASGNLVSGVISNASDYGSNANAKDLRVTKSNTSEWTLTNTSTYTGTTSVTGGTLTLGNGGNLGNTAVTVSNGATFAAKPGVTGATNALGSSLVLNAGSTFTMADAATSTLTVAGNTTFGGGATSSLVFEIGGSPTAVDTLTIAGAATIGASGETISINGIGLTALTLGSYTLISGGAGSALDVNPFALASSNVLVNGTLYSISLTSAPTTVALNVLSVLGSGVPTAYWTGDQSGVWNTVNAGPNTNWATNSGGGTDAGATPNLVTDVFSPLLELAT